jgi:hypothetical protein
MCYCIKGVGFEKTDVQYDTCSKLRFCAAVVLLIQITLSNLDWQTTLSDLTTLTEFMCFCKRVQKSHCKMYHNNV